MNKKGFTLIELLIVVAIIGIIAAIAIPNLLIALQKGKQKASMGDMRTIGTGVSTYIVDWSFAPVGAGTVAAVLQNSWFTPFYIKLLPPTDAWGSAFTYAANGDNYFITSGGRNKAIDGTIGLYEVTSITDFDQDLVFSEIFTVGPIVKK